MLAALSGSTAALVTGLCIAAAVWFGAEHVMSAPDFHLPVRQLLLGRTLQAVVMYARYVRTLITARVTGRQIPPPIVFVGQVVLKG